MLEAIAPNLWTAQQPFTYLGLNVGTRMTVIRLSDQTLAIISAIELTESLKAELAQLGTVSHIIAPNLYHYLYAESYKHYYPEAIFWATEGLKEKRPHLSIDRLIQPDGTDLWCEIDATFFAGLKTLGLNGFDSFNEWVFFHIASRTLIVTDVAFRYDESFPFVERLAARILGCYKTLSPSVLERIATKDTASIKASVEKVLSWDFERVIVAHGNMLEKGGKQAFRDG